MGFVVDRHNKIEAFKPEAFWSIVCKLKWKDEDGQFKDTGFKWERDRVFDQNACTIFY